MKKLTLFLTLFSLQSFAATCSITMTIKDRFGFLTLPTQPIYAENLEECTNEAQYSYRFFDRFLDDKVTLKNIEISYIESEIDLEGNISERKIKQNVKPGYKSINAYLYPVINSSTSGRNISSQSEKKTARIEAQRQRDNLRNN